MRRKIKLITLIVACLMSSCNISKMRYSRGYRLEFIHRSGKSDSRSEYAKCRQIKQRDIRPDKIYDVKEETSFPIADSLEKGRCETSAGFADKARQGEYNSTPALPLSSFFGKLKSFDNKQNKINGPPTDTNEEKKSGVFAVLGLLCSLMGLIPFYGVFLVLAAVFIPIGLNRKRRLRGIAWLALAVFAIAVLLLIVAV